MKTYVKKYVEQFKKGECKAYSLSVVPRCGFPNEQCVFSIHFFDSLERVDAGFSQIGYVIPGMSDKVTHIRRFNAVDTDLVPLD